MYRLGTLYDEEGNATGVRNTLSWTSYSMWRNSPHSYKKRYFDGVRPPVSKEIKFGREYGKMLEDDDDVQGSETFIEHFTPCGLRMIGYLDSYDASKNRIIEYKTGHVPWTRLKVAKHKQLDFYSMLVWKQHGYVDDVVKLVWIETEKVPEKKTGPLGNKSSIQLQGERHIFEREITEAERQRLYDDIILAAKEITCAYNEYEQAYDEEIKKRNN